MSVVSIANASTLHEQARAGAAQMTAGKKSGGIQVSGAVPLC